MKLYQFAGMAALALAATSVSQAYPIMKLSDILVSTMTDDNGSITTMGSVSSTGGSSDGTGSVEWEGDIGGWTLNTDSGISGPDAAHLGVALDLSFLDTASGPSAFGPSNMLVISWTELFDASFAGPVSAHISGNLAEGTTATFSVLEDDTQITPTLTFVGGPGVEGNYSGDTTADLFKSTDVTTLTEVITLTATETGQSGGDASVQAPPSAPDPALTAVLMGFGIGALVLFSVANRRKA